MERIRKMCKGIAVAMAMILVFQIGMTNVHAAETNEAIKKTVDENSAAGKGGAKVKSGDIITYKISYQNTSDKTEKLTLTDKPGAGLSYKEAGNSGKYDDKTGVVTWNLGEVAAGTKGSVTLKVKVTDKAEEKVGNAASLKIGDKDAVTSTVTNEVGAAAINQPVPETQAQTEPEAVVPETDPQPEPEAVVPETDPQPDPEPIVPETDPAPAAEVDAQPEAPKANKVTANDDTDSTEKDSDPTDISGDDKSSDDDKTTPSDDGKKEDDQDKDKEEILCECEEEVRKVEKWEVVKEATCTEKGQEKGICTVCEGIVYRDIEKVPHNFVDKDYKVTKKPTCTVKGEETATCANEGCTEPHTREIKALGHDYEEKTIDPTCEKAGKVIKVCKTCGDEQLVKTLDKLEHKPGKWTESKAPTCTEDGEEIQVCSLCKKTVNTRIVSKTGHDWEKTYTVDKAPTKTKEGSKSIHCKNCKDTKDAKSIPATGDHSVTGIKAGTTYKRGEKITFTVAGIGMDNKSPIKGEERFVPVSWSVGTSGKWTKAPYTASFTIDKAGNYTLKITMDKEVYDGSEWKKDGTTDTKEISFKVSSEKYVAKASVPKTGDNAPYMWLIGVLVVSGAVLGITQRKRLSRK